MDLSPGSRLGPYEILSRLGAGGMGEVYRARDTRLERSVAIKVLPSELATNDRLRTRFEREAKVIARLEHTHILPVYDYGRSGNLLYLAMRYVESGTLKGETRECETCRRSGEMTCKVCKGKGKVSNNPLDPNG